jgi:hypothetical protein
MVDFAMSYSPYCTVAKTLERNLDYFMFSKWQGVDLTEVLDRMKIVSFRNWVRSFRGADSVPNFSVRGGLVLGPCVTRSYRGSDLLVARIVGKSCESGQILATPCFSHCLAYSSSRRYSHFKPHSQPLTSDFLQPFRSQKN